MNLGFNAGFHSARPRPDLTPIARSFPISALPPVFRGAALYVSKSKQISTTITGMAVSGLASLIVQNLARFKMPGENGDTRPGSTYSVIITPTTANASRALEKFIPVIQAYDKASVTSHLQAMKQFERAHEDWKDDRKALRSSIRKLRRDGNPWQHVQAELDEHDKKQPPKPIGTRLLFSDITDPSFIAQLDGVSRSVGLVSDDADTFYECLPRLSTHFNRGFDGRPITIRRAKGESGVAYDSSITVLLSVQNDIINRFDNSHGPKMRSIGLRGTQLFGAVSNVVDEHFLSDVYVCADALAAYLECQSVSLAEIERRRREGITELDEIELDQEATECWEAFAKEMNVGMNCDDRVGPLVDISDFASRAAEHAGRLATGWTVLSGEKNISLETIKGAIEVIRFHLAEFQDRYSLLHAVPELILQAYDLDRYLHRIWKEGHKSVPKSFIERNAKGDFRNNVASLDAALELLQMMSRVQLIPGRGRGLQIKYVPHPGRPFQFYR